MKKIYIFISLLLLVLFAAGCSSNNQVTGNTVKQSQDINNLNDYEVIPISEISESMKKYSMNFNGIEIRYFVVKDGFGNVKTAFDACDVCGGHLGYRQEGKDVVCNKCGQYFNIIDLGSNNKKGGGCWPSHLNHIIEGENILIKKSDLESGSFRFA